MADKGWPPILLYGVIINQAIKSGDKDVMKAVLKVSNFMKSHVSRSDEDTVRDWYDAHEDLQKALG